MSMTSRLRGWARALKRDTLVVYFAARDPRTPWGVRLLALGVAAYALSPIDLIPDFIPVLGYLDDLLIVPLGIALVMRWLPAGIKADAHARAAAMAERPTSRGMAMVIGAIWIAAIALVATWGYGIWRAHRA
ncbi:YkvA family protein [Lysobacter claricitrinus]|uniref:YkvA family protein n=1 Tax=Lysobacter claricitrinus TaxID=3367728 RepID=UPI0037DB4046